MSAAAVLLCGPRAVAAPVRVPDEIAVVGTAATSAAAGVSGCAVGVLGEDGMDRWLASQAAAGDLDAFIGLLRRHQDRIYRVALGIVGDPHDAQDVAQDVAVVLWRAIGSYSGASSFTTWLHRIVVNRSLTHAHRRHPPTLSVEPDTAASAGTEDIVMAAETLQRTLEAIAGLSPELRVVLVLHQIEGHTYNEIAETLALSETTVRGRLHRARRRLLEALTAADSPG